MNKFFIIENIAKDLGIKEKSIKETINLLENGATIPFIARYRKENTFGLDETQIRFVFEKYDYYIELEKRKDTILKTIKSQGKLTAELENKIKKTVDKVKLEDLYLPYKPKKRTKATVAKEKGLEPLADIIWRQEEITDKKTALLSRFINVSKGVCSEEDALAGALDIIAERIADEDYIRGWIRDMVKTKGELISKPKSRWKAKKSKYSNYYEYSEYLKSIPSHRLLAIRRGTIEGILSWKINVDEKNIIDFIKRMIIKNDKFCFYKDILKAITDSYKRLLFPSIEKEAFRLKEEDSGKEAITVFSKNLKNLLLASPAGSKVIMGIDPGYRTGCKIAIIDGKGDLLTHTTIVPFEGKAKRDESKKIICSLITEYKVNLIAIGNGTASKETDSIVSETIEENNLDVISLIISEAGASVYSASKVAKKEFPDLDVTVRGAISIGRRLQDPLSELVKIDPKSIGVGQYQHDVNQKELKKSLDLVVESCVNYVGVDLNTASVELLSYVSGIHMSIAENIAKYRSMAGGFKGREELLKVNKLGLKAYEQCAGFLRVRNSNNPLDNSGIHPETYPIVEKMSIDINIPVEKLIKNNDAISRIEINNYVDDKFGLPTLKDIIKELRKPGLDPRKEFSSVHFSSHINKIDDLSEGMILTGTITNVTNFGAFVDIGVHQDGLVHISKLSNQFVRNPHDIVSVGDTVQVKVLSVDIQLKRVSLQRIE